MVGVYSIAIYATENSLAGIHIWDSSFDTLRDEALNAWMGALTFITGTCCLKVSVLLFYRRIQTSTYDPKMYYAIWAAIIFTITYTVAMVLALILNCQPTQAYWLAYDASWSETHDFKCADTGIINLVAGVLSIITDAYSIALPCIVAQGLKIPLRQKIILNMFGISLVTIGAAITRTYLYYKMSYHYDFTWVAFDVYFWTMLEFGLGIMCACAPSLRVFIKRYIGEPLSSARSGNGSGLQWNGKRRGRSESQSELTGRRGLTESYTSAIVAKMTVQVSSGEKKAEELDMRMRPSPFDLNEDDKSMFAMATMTDSTFDPSARGSDASNNVGPRSPKEYELETLANLHQGRKSLSQATARRRPSEAGHPVRF